MHSPQEKSTADEINEDKIIEGLEVQEFVANPALGDEIVISGLSGTFPSSKNVHEFRDHLYNKVDMVTSNLRWDVTNPGVPPRSGLIPAIDKYDTGYFGVHYRQAKSLDPMATILQEKTIEAILDAGLQPADFENTNTGVYIGSCLSENDKHAFIENKTSQYYSMTGSIKSMQAHRLSYLLKLKGPSFCVDTACSSSFIALEEAYRAIRLGEVDAAIVGGINLCLLQYMTLQFAKLGALSPDGISKSFDQKANGYVRSEACMVIIIQKMKSAKRVYAQLCHVASNCDGYTEQGITFPSASVQEELLTRFYQECGVDPSSLSFLEAHGTGTAVGDPEECLAIDNVFTKGRRTPLLMGSVKSSIGHSEPASGLCSMLKCILAMETGLISPNIHLNQLNEKIRGLIEGRMIVVLDTTPLEDDRGLMAVSNFGFGGGNGHALLKWNEKLKTNKGLPEDDLPRLVCVSGRTLDAVETLLDAVSQNEFDAEFVGLIHESFRNHIENHLYRGYTIVSKLGEICRSSPNLQGGLKPLVVVFDELLDWYQIGKQLMSLLPFKASMQRIQKILPPGYVNICEMLRKHNKTPEKQSVSQLGNAVIQICIMDILHMINVKPNSYIGHSSGELLSSYYNGLITLEETVNSAVNNTSITNNNREKKYNGVGVNNDAHINGNVNTNSRKPNSTMLKLGGKQRFSTSVWGNNNELLKSNPIILKIGKRSVGDSEDSNMVSLFEEFSDDYLKSFLECLGRLYEIGYNPHLSKLYPPIQFPVSRSTRMISPYIKWNHRRTKFVPLIHSERVTMAQKGVKQYIIQATEQWAYITGHVIDGRNLFPAMGYLYLVWDTLSSATKVLLEDINVAFENCRFIRATTVSSKGELVLEVTINFFSGNFEISEGDSVVVQGRIIKLDKNKTDSSIPKSNEPLNESDLSLTSKDVYKELRLRGYGYSGAFRAIEKSNIGGTKALVRWDNNWVTFLDNLLQLKILQLDSRFLYVPVFVSNISIFPEKHTAMIQRETKGNNARILSVYSDQVTSSIRSGGVTVSGLLAQSIPRKQDLGIPVLERYEFIPNIAELNTDQSVRVNMQIILENSLMYQVKVVEVIDEFSQEALEPLASTIKLSLEAQPLVQPAVKILSKYPIITDVEIEDKPLNSETNCLLVIASCVSKRKNVLVEAFAALENGYIISREARNFDAAFLDNDVNILTVHRSSEETLILLQGKIKQEKPIYINIASTNQFSWIPQLQSDLKKNKDVILYAENEPTSGIVGLTNCLRREADSKHVRCVFLKDEGKTFQPTETDLANQLKRNMAINIYKDYQWGTYRHLLVDNENSVEREHCFATVMKRGELSSLRWIEGPLSQRMITDKTLVHVYYAALNFRDIMTATGKISPDIITKSRMEQECVQGIEFSGRDNRGNRVMGMINCGALSSLVIADPYLCYQVPDSWSLEEAATVIIAYGTVIYALVVRGQMRKGDSILIHSGSGGVGQAAIGFCLFHGCTVFTTVGTAEKREFLKNKFPALHDSHIGNSHDESFEQMIFRETKGKGVDLVLNSLSEEKLVASVRCLAKGGKLLEIGKNDLINNNSVNLRLFQKDVIYQGVMLDQLLNAAPEKKIEVCQAFLNALKSGAIKPLSRNIFHYEELEQAFRFMSTGKHMGKVLIKIREPEEELICIPRCEKFTGLARYFCNPEKAYIVIGGLGGFGLELADWLVLRGARKLIINSRKGISSGYQRTRIGLWSSYGTIVKISTAPVTTREGCKKLIEESLKLGRIDAIFNLAVVLEDAVFQNQTPDSFIKSFGPKATASTYLDELTRELCPDLRGFVIFSSVSCGRGNAGQTNYGMANSVMERICERRKKDGFPALAIEWGAIGEVGLVADMMEDNTELVISGTLQQKISSCLQVLDTFLTQRDSAIVSSMVVAEKKRASSSENIIDAVSCILGLTDLTAVSVHSTFAELGMDSMTGIEMKQVLERDFDVYLTAKEIRTLTLAKLKELQEDKFRIEQTPDSMEEKFGLEMVFRLLTGINIDAPYIQLKSKIEENSTTPKVFLLPGIDGCAPVFETLASKLSANLICLQYPCRPLPFSELVQSIASTIQELLPKTEPFIVLAYSYGTMVALEVTEILLSRGYTSTVISLDGSPAQSHQMINYFGVSSKSTFQTELICHLISFVFDNLTPAHKEFISQGNTWEERLERGLSLAKDKLGDQIDHSRNLCNSIIWRVEGVLSYNPSYKKTKANIKLYKAKRNIPGLEDDYNLSKICGRPVDVEEIEGNHVTFLENPQLAESIITDLEKYRKL